MKLGIRLALILLLLASNVFAFPQDQTKYDTWAADIRADPAFFAGPVQIADNATIAAAYNALASPDFWVWKSSLTEKAVYEETSVDGTTWSWQTYIAQSVAERDSWARMYTGGGLSVNPSLPQTRINMIGDTSTANGAGSIFQGTAAGVVAQRTHLQAMMRRKANRLEKLFKTGPGTGTSAAPANMTVEGTVKNTNVAYALNGGTMPPN